MDAIERRDWDQLKLLECARRCSIERSKRCRRRRRLVPAENPSGAKLYPLQAASTPADLAAGRTTIRPRGARADETSKRARDPDRTARTVPGGRGREQLGRRAHVPDPGPRRHRPRSCASCSVLSAATATMACSPSTPHARGEAPRAAVARRSDRPLGPAPGRPWPAGPACRGGPGPGRMGERPTVDSPLAAWLASRSGRGAAHLRRGVACPGHGRAGDPRRVVRHGAPGPAAGPGPAYRPSAQPGRPGRSGPVHRGPTPRRRRAPSLARRTTIRVRPATNARPGRGR